MNDTDLAIKIVYATQWSSDLRGNMTRVVGAGRVLAKEIERLRDALEELVDLQDGPSCRPMPEYREVLGRAIARANHVLGRDGGE